MLKDRVNEEMKNAMRARDELRVGTLRMLFSSIKDFEINNGHVIAGDKDVVAVCRKSVKARQDAIEEFRKGGRQDLIDRESAEIRIIEEFLPAPIDEAEVRRIVAEAVESTGASSMKDMGKVMKESLVRLAGAVDGSIVSSLVKELLSRRA